jgi:peptidoglycan/LPS O-acetylase OafA/YrhL
MRGYRADIDGLRAISVLLVLFFHLGIGVHGGFIGVDVFFVISGYLITGIILSEITAGQFSLLDFYERRARRILPALITVVLMVMLAGYFLLYPDDYTTLGKSAVAALGAASNFFFLFNTGYFDAPAQTEPLLHTWSLGVEEQFYLVWPTFLLLASKLMGKSRPRWIVLLAVIAIASFGAAVRQVEVDPKAAFYLPYTRAWELAMGALLHFLPPWRSRMTEALPLLGVAAILWSAFTLTAEQPFPGLNAVAPTIGAALVIYPNRTLAGAALGFIAPLGLVSYSLYLWHWPLIVFWRIYTNGAVLTAGESVAIITAALALSVLSWRYIEQPARRIRFRRTLPLLLSADVAAAAILAPVVLTGGLPFRVPQETRALGTLEQRWEWKCPENIALGLPGYPSTTVAGRSCVGGAPWATASHHAILWGDSIAESTMPLLDVAGRRYDTSIALANTCPAILHKGVARRYWPERPAYNEFCDAQRAALLKLLHDTPHIDLIVLQASWTYLAHELDVSDSDQRSEKMGLRIIRSGFADLLPRLIVPGRKVILLGDFPDWNIGQVIPCAFHGTGLLRLAELSVLTF